MYLVSLNGYEKISVSLGKIAEVLNFKSKTMISNSLNNLKELNYITIEKQYYHKWNIYKLNLDNKQPAGKLAQIDPLKCINSDVSEIVLSELGSDKNFLNQLMKTNKEKIEDYQKYFMLLYLIKKIQSMNEVNNYKAYLLKSFSNQSYSEYHKEVFQNKQKIKNADIQLSRPSKFQSTKRNFI